jgi:type IV pilus assembly protein PilA
VVLTYGNNASKNLDGKKLTIRPAVVKDTPAVPIAWLCAQVSVPAGMEVMGTDVTDIKASWLPIDCRGPETNK